MKTLDFLGEMCPIPIIKTKAALKDLKKDQSIMIITDHSCVLQSLEEYLSKLHYVFEVDEVINGVWEITITK